MLHAIKKLFRNTNKTKELPPSYDSISLKSTPPPYSSDLCKSEEYEKPPQYDMLSTDTIDKTDITKLINTLYKMGQKSYIIIDMSTVNLKKLLLEIAKNHPSLSVFQFFTSANLIFNSISIKINDSTVNITEKMIIFGFNNIVIEYENSSNSKKINNHNATLCKFQMVGYEHFASIYNHSAYYHNM